MDADALTRHVRRGLLDSLIRRDTPNSKLAIHARLGYEEAMKETYTAVIKRAGNWWIGWIEEVPGVNCQEATREELLESLRQTLREALEFNRREAIDAAGEGFAEESIAL